MSVPDALFPPAVTAENSERLLSRDDRVSGCQSWRNLTFLHWRFPAAAVQSLLPPELTVETFDESAWIGLVPFSMERVRPWWAPPVPGISWFPETNVRTYVRHRSGATGVWFFSLDAGSRLAVRVARRFWGLPYFDAAMSVDVSETATGRRQASYRSERARPGGARCHVRVVWDGDSSPEESRPGTLEYFLVERYVLFTQTRRRGLLMGRVAHEPYRISHVTVEACRQTLLTAAGLELNEDRRPDLAVFSPGVDVTVHGLRPMTADAG